MLTKLIGALLSAIILVILLAVGLMAFRYTHPSAEGDAMQKTGSNTMPAATAANPVTSTPGVAVPALSARPHLTPTPARAESTSLSRESEQKIATPEPENGWALLGQASPIWSERSGRVLAHPIAVDPADSQRLAYCTAGAIRLSGDGGKTWSEISTGSVAAIAETSDYPFMDREKASPACREVLLDPAHPETVYAVFVTVKRPNLVAPPLYFVAYVTADRGKTWEPVPPPVGSTLGQFGGFRVEGKTVKALFHRQSTDDREPFFSVVQTKDGGQTWTPGKLECPPAGPCIRFGPAGSAVTGMADIIQPVIRSTDGGKSWAKITDVHEASVRWLPGPHALVTLWPTTVAYLAGSAQQPFLLSKDAGVTWSAITLPPLPGRREGQDRFPGLQLLPDGVLLAQNSESGIWYLLPPGASQWCPAAGVSLPTTRGDPPTLQVIGDRIWWLESDSPKSVPLTGLGCGSAATPPAAAPAATPTAAPFSDLSACLAADLSATAFWQGAGGQLVGGIVFANQGKDACFMSIYPSFDLVDATGHDLDVDVQVMPLWTDKLFVLRPSEEASFRLQWSNWCGPQPEGGVMLRATLAGQLGQLTVKDKVGNPLPTGARCNAPGLPSRLTIGAFVPTPTPTPTKVPGQVGFRTEELTDVTEIIVLNYAKTAEKMTGDVTLVKPVLDALAAARFVGVDRSGGKRDDGVYMVHLKRKSDLPFVFLYRPANAVANVEDPGPGEVWQADGLDAAMQPLLPLPLPTGPVVGTPRALLDQPIPDLQYRFSPDGQWLSYQVGPGAIKGDAFANGGLVAHHVDGKIIPLVPGGRISAHDWFPDNQQLVVVIGPGDGHLGEILVKPLGFPEQAPARTLLEAPANTQGFDEAVVSPDGKWIAYTVLYHASPAPVPKIAIEVINVDGTGRRQIVEPEYFVGQLTWTPDGRQIVYFKGKGGTPPDDGESYVANADGTLQRPEQLLPRLRLAAWSSDGKQALWLTHPVEDENQAGLVVTNWPDVNPTRFIAKNVSAGAVDWVGSSGWVVFASNGALYLAPASGEEGIRRLTTENERADRPVWLPGAGIAYLSSSGSEGASRLRLVPVP